MYTREDWNEDFGVFPCPFLCGRIKTGRSWHWGTGQYALLVAIQYCGPLNTCILLDLICLAMMDWSIIFIKAQNHSETNKFPVDSKLLDIRKQEKFLNAFPNKILIFMLVNNLKHQKLESVQSKNITKFKNKRQHYYPNTLDKYKIVLYYICI